MHRQAAHHVRALLLARMYEVPPLLRAQRGGAMKIIAFITETVVIREILGHLGEPKSPPRLMPAGGPPLWEMPGSDPALHRRERARYLKSSIGIPILLGGAPNLYPAAI